LKTIIIVFYFYFQFLDQDNVINDFNKALEKYIKLSALHPSHFESEKIDYNEDFYHWAFNYITNRDEFNWRLDYLKISHCDFKTQVIFLIIYIYMIRIYTKILLIKLEMHGINAFIRKRMPIRRNINLYSVIRH
jgi:hypothetical protein